jgi:hypothetical protein
MFSEDEIAGQKERGLKHTAAFYFFSLLPKLDSIGHNKT